MKNTIKTAAVIALSLFAAACAKVTTDEPSNEGQELHFIVNTAENAVVKSFIDNNLNGTYTPKWSKGDELAIFVGETANVAKATGVLTNANAQGTTASFGGTITGIPTAGTFKSFAPSSAFEKGYSDGTIGINLASMQKPSSLTIDQSCDILVAKEAGYTADAGDKVTVNDLFFKRMFSVVKVALTGPTALNGEKVQKFSLTAPEGTVLAGCAAINLSTATVEKWTISNNIVTAAYATDAPVFGSDTPGLGNVVWLVVNPGTIASGAKLTFAGETAGYTFSKEVTLSKDLVFPESQLAVINLNLADEHCTKKATPAAASWIATDLADIAATDEVVITMAKGESVYALTSAKGSKEAPTAVAVTVENKELTAAPEDNLVWNIVNDNGNLTIYPKGQTATWLYTTNNNNGVRVGTNDNKTFTLDATTKYLKNTGTSRYLGVYNSQDWRCYTSTSTNIGGQTLCFYVKGTPKTALETPANLQVSAAKVVSWDAVSGAASYEVTIGKDVFTSETTSYDATAVVDDYYDVAVVAVPSDKENYKNSAAATLSGAKFGTPKLTTPELTEGAIDESSIRVNMTVDARAANGCTCEIYNGETLVESKTIKAKYVVFSGLESGVTYTIKINAIAVEGEKPYAASDVASIELKTKATQHVSDVTAAGTYTIKGLTVYAVANASLVVAGDNTGYILVYKSSHGLKVGTTFNVAGTVKNYNGVWEFDSPSITGNAVGETPVYPEAIEADEAYLASYGTATKIEYVHAKGIQSGRNIKVGEQTLYLSAETPETDGKTVEVSGFVYGYNTKFSSASFVATSIQLDSSIPSLSVDQTSKTWAADATDAFVVKVTVNSEGGDWTVTPETLSWATIAVDKTAGTITVTPSGANETETANEATLIVTHTSDASLTKEITLKQNAAGAVLEKSEIIDLSKGVFVGGDKPIITWSGTSCSFVQTKGTSNTPPKKDYIAAPRWYQNNVITFKANAGYEITKVVVTCVNGKNDNYKYVNALKDSTYSPKETTSATASETKVTIITAGDFTITMGAQSRISSVVVYYTE